MTSQSQSDQRGDSSQDFDSERIAAQLKKWQERLLDLTRANPLLGINRSRVSKLQTVEPDAASLFARFVLEEEELRMPLIRKKPKPRLTGESAGDEQREDEYTIEPGDVSFDGKPADLLRRLRRIFDNARTTVEERGVTTLHLAFGVLKWEEPSLGESTSPLWLVPCQFEYLGPNTALRLQRADEEMQVNPALELYLRERHHLSLPPIPEELAPEDLTRYLQAVTHAVREQGWAVADEVWLSTFSFESLVIYQDLKVLGNVAAASPIVAALARAGHPVEGAEALGEELDDLPTPDRVPVPVLPADASQLRALTLAVGTRNLVIHGPPGTGKSQTISNLIADALGRRQTVLFVSAKMAALDVVHQRLAERGLARFCLEAHSTKAGKAKIIEELKRTLENTGDGGGHRLEEQLEELRQVRSGLNDYVRQLHERREPLGLSVYQAIGKVAKLSDAPSVGIHALPWEDPTAVSRTDLRSAIDALDELASQADVFDARGNHPWRGLTVEKGGILEDALELALMTTLRSTEQLLEALQSLESLFGPSATACSIENIRALVPALSELDGCKRLPEGWQRFSVEELQAAVELLVAAEVMAKQLSRAQAQYRRHVAIPYRDCQTLLAPLKGEFRSWTRGLKPKYWRWRATVRASLAPGAAAGFAALRSYHELAGELAQTEAWFESHDQDLARLVASNHARDASALAAAASEHRAATHLRCAIPGHEFPASPDRIISPAVKTAAKRLRELAGDSAFAKALGDLDRAWPGGFVDDTAAATAPIMGLAGRCQETTDAFTRLHEWVLLNHTLRRCRDLGLDRFVEALGSISARSAPSAFEQAFYTVWTKRVIERAPALQLFSPQRRAERVERFRRLDERIRQSALSQIKAAATEPAYRIASAQTNLGDSGEVGVLRRELQKRKRIKPLRKLFAEIPHALQALKPCMLMSPLSVSTFLKPGSISFDLVVFDEASQLPTPQAIPSILRGRQVVVAGDEKQLPPTSFFEASVIFDEDAPESELEEGLEPLESLLDDCVAINPVFQPTFLAWHYRSRDERLINFSNHYFYNNKLVTFPSATTSNDGRGVHHLYVADGVWDRGRSRTNRREAQRVAELIVDQVDRFPDRSLGVAAMNATQREAIEMALNELIEQRPDLAPLLSTAQSEPFFIKALENVQGDERDTIIISVGYAKTQSGTLSLNFGPLNREGGWRRLNVLVTRAKWQTILVTSIRSQDLAAVNPNNRGAFMLRKFIEYAEKGGALPADPVVRPEAETNDFEEAVAETLRQRDLSVDEQVGVGSYRIDLAIRDPRDPARYLIGVECDGATYHSARTARDRDLLRQQILRNQGWRLHRLWSTDWFRDREKAVQGILRSVELAMQSPPSESIEAPPLPPPPPESTPRPPGPTPTSLGESVANRTYKAGVPYRKYRAPRPLASDGIMNLSHILNLAAQVASVVRHEGPIHPDVLLERLKEIHSVLRAGTNILNNVRQATAIAVTNHGLSWDADRCFLSAGAVDEFRVPGDGVERAIHHIAPEEIALAALYAVEDQFGLPRDHLPRAVAELLGIRRAKVGVAEAVGSVVDGLIEDGRLRLSGPNVYLP
jgi:very-short-patch-repair endonuclease